MKDLEKIIRYLDGEMKGEEKHLFEQELVGDKSIKQSKLLMEEIDRAIDDDQVFAFKAKLQETEMLYNVISDVNYVVSDGTVNGNVITHKQQRINWKYAAAVVTLLIVISTMFFNFSKSSNDKIFASYYKRYEANYEASEVNTRGTADVNNVSKLINAVQLYDQGKFIPAIGQFEEILKTDAGNMAAHFFAGIALIEIRDYDKAIENLLFVISKKDMAYIEHSEWYLALCYLKKNETSKAVTMLKTIADNNSYYKTRALELLKQLQ